jgi:transposase-like protein
MQITIAITCPRCHSGTVTRNGKKNKGIQNYRCKDCSLFIGDHEHTYGGTLSWVKNTIKIMVVRGIGIWDIRAVLKISITTVLQVLTSMKYPIKMKQHQYDCLEIDEFWTYGGEKKDKVWLI